MSLLTLHTKQFGGPVTTEWEDTLRLHGIIPPLESEDTEPEELPDAPAPAAAGPSAADAADDDEEELLQRLRAQRLAELKAGRFGSVLPLARDDYQAEVNQAGEGVGVVVFLCKPRHYLSTYTLVLIERLARKFPDVKFMQIESSECIPGYPDRNLPTLLVYRDDDLLAQLVGPAAFGGTSGGASFGIDDVEWELAQAGVLTTDLPANPHAKGPRG